MSLLKKILRGDSLKKTDKGIIASPDNLAIINAPSFVDLLPVKGYCGDGIFYFRDLKNIGAMLNFVPISLEGKNKEQQNAILNDLNFAIKTAIPNEYSEFWHSQIFITKVKTTKSTLAKVKKHTKVKTKFSEDWHQKMEQHLESLSNEKGAFVDKNTGVAWYISELKISICLYQETSPTSTKPVEQRIKETTTIVERLQSALDNTGIKISTVDSQGYIDNLSLFFHKDKIVRNININSILNEDLSQNALNKVRINCENGIFNFNRGGNIIYSTFMPIESIESDAELGHITAEHKNNVAIIDKLPVGSVYTQAMIHLHQDAIIEQLEIIKKKAIGTEDSSLINRSLVEEALANVANGKAIYRVSGGVYIQTDKKEDVDILTRDAKSLFGSKGIELLRTDENPLAENDFICHLPFCFSYAEDNKIYNKRAILEYLPVINKLAPFTGRSKSRGNASLVKFNRGGEPLLFDPLADRVNNAYGLILGPMGSGKSAFLVDFLLNMIATYNPRVFIIEKGNSFGLLVEHCKNMGLSTNKVAINAGSSDIKLPPFADATQLLDEKSKSSLDGRDLLGELLIVARLMITGGEEKEEDKFERSDWDTIAEAIKLAAQMTVDDNRETTLTKDVINAIEQLSDSSELMDDEKARMRKMAKAMKVFINTDFSNKIFNTEGEMFPERDITQLDVGILGDEGYQDKLAVAFISLMSNINKIAERTQFDNRPILILVDEAHLITTNPLLAPYVVKITKMWRKLGAWLWLATQSLDDYKDSSEQMLSVMEWWICLSFKPAEVEAMKRFKKLTTEQEDLLLSTTNASGQYKEGVVFGENFEMLIRNIPPALSLALAQTEDHEKANRKRIMDKLNCTEIEAVYQIEAEILNARNGNKI